MQFAWGMGMYSLSTVWGTTESKQMNINELFTASPSFSFDLNSPSAPSVLVTCVSHCVTIAAKQMNIDKLFPPASLLPQCTRLHDRDLQRQSSRSSFRAPFLLFHLNHCFRRQSKKETRSEEAVGICRSARAGPRRHRRVIHRRHPTPVGGGASSPVCRRDDDEPRLLAISRFARRRRRGRP